MALPQGGPSTRTEQLTQREHAVLSLMAQGLTTPEIAESLHIAPATVKAHTSSILLKLDVRNRTEAVLVSMGVAVPGRADRDV
jgi:DNA-binding NarL/FixJ family response regulator